MTALEKLRALYLKMLADWPGNVPEEVLFLGIDRAKTILQEIRRMSLIPEAELTPEIRAYIKAATARMADQDEAFLNAGRILLKARERMTDEAFWKWVSKSSPASREEADLMMQAAREENSAS